MSDLHESQVSQVETYPRLVEDGDVDRIRATVAPLAMYADTLLHDVERVIVSKNPRTGEEQSFRGIRTRRLLSAIDYGVRGKNYELLSVVTGSGYISSEVLERTTTLPNGVEEKSTKFRRLIEDDRPSPDMFKVLDRIMSNSDVFQLYVDDVTIQRLEPTLDAVEILECDGVPLSVIRTRLLGKSLRPDGSAIRQDQEDDAYYHNNFERAERIIAAGVSLAKFIVRDVEAFGSDALRQTAA